MRNNVLLIWVSMLLLATPVLTGCQHNRGIAKARVSLSGRGMGTRSVDCHDGNVCKDDESCCGGNKCCPQNCPHLCRSSGWCYQYLEDAKKDCGSSVEVCYK